MAEPERNESEQQAASDRELRWMLLGTLFAGLMIAVAVFISGSVGD